MNSLHTFTRKHRAYCVFYRINIVCLEHLSSFIFQSVDNIINIPRLLGLFGENIGPPGLGSRDRGLPPTQLITYLSSSNYSKLSGNSTSLPQKNILFTLSIIALNSRAREDLRNSYFQCKYWLKSGTHQFSWDLIQYIYTGSPNCKTVYLWQNLQSLVRNSLVRCFLATLGSCFSYRIVVFKRLH